MFLFFRRVTDAIWGILSGHEEDTELTLRCLNTSAATHISSLQIYSSQGDPRLEILGVLWNSSIQFSSCSRCLGAFWKFGLWFYADRRIELAGRIQNNSVGASWEKEAENLAKIPGKHNRLNLASQLVIYSVCRKDVGTQPIPASPVYIVSGSVRTYCNKPTLYAPRDKNHWLCYWKSIDVKWCPAIKTQNTTATH